MGKQLEQALLFVYTLQCLTGKVDNNNDCSIRLSRSRGVAKGGQGGAFAPPSLNDFLKTFVTSLPVLN